MLTEKLKKKLFISTIKVSFSKCNLMPDFNPFLADGFILYLLETLQKPFNFMVFSGGRKRGHWSKMS